MQKLNRPPSASGGKAADNEGAVGECILPVTWLLGTGFEGDFE